MTPARIIQLYPDELGVAGDRGNTLAIAARLASAGIESETVLHQRGTRLPSTADVVVVGGGPLSAMRNVHSDLMADRAQLRDWAANGVPIFAYGSGAELLGHSITLVPDPRSGARPPAIGGLGIFPFRTVRVPERTVGYVVVDSPWGRLVGFEDNASRWELDGGAQPVGTVVTGDGNGDGNEGVLMHASIATQMGGPLLPLNPQVTDRLITAVAARLGVEIPAAEPSERDEYARKAREVMTEHAAHVFSRI